MSLLQGQADGGIAYQAEEGMGVKRNLKQFIHPEAFIVQMMKAQIQCETGQEQETNAFQVPTGKLRDDF